MNRPSHWILASFLVAGTALWLTGEFAGTAAPERPATAVDRDDAQPVAPRVVRREVPPPAPAIHELSGRVVDRFGHPVVAARIARLGGRSAPAVTDQDGGFRLRWVGPLAGRLEFAAPGRYATSYRAPELAPMQVVLHDILPWAAERPAVEPDPARLLGEGFLRDETGRHVAGGRVAVAETGATAVADDSGRYRVPLRAGAVTLIAWDTSGRVATTPVDVTHTEGLQPLPELALQPGPRVQGRVLDAESRPADDVAVELRFAGAVRVVHTDAAGRFEVAALADSRARLTVYPHRGHLGVRHEWVLGDDPEVALGDIQLELPAHEPLGMYVVDLARQPRSALHVVAEQAGGLCRAYGRSDASGRVWLTGLGAASALTFEVRDTRHDVLPIEGFDAKLPALIVAR